jgi:hypothetical protein
MSKEKLFTKKEGSHYNIPKKIADAFWRRSISPDEAPSLAKKYAH